MSEVCCLPVLQPDGTGAWDGGSVAHPFVIQRGPRDFTMWYEGEDDRTWTRRIGHAVSSDGLVWKKSPADPVLGPGPRGSWSEFGVGTPTVVYDGDLYRMWYTGTDSLGKARIGCAVSQDGFRWRPWPHPVFVSEAPGNWDGSGVSDPFVIYDRGMFRMWFCGSDLDTLTGDAPTSHFGIGYACSMDGVSWRRSNLNPILSAGDPGTWEEALVRKPCVIRDGRLYRMWYVGADRSGRTAIGCALSSNGISWTKCVSNPVLSPAGSWETDLRSCHALLEEGSLQMWTSGDDSREVGRIRHRSVAMVSEPELVRAAVD